MLFIKLQNHAKKTPQRFHSKVIHGKKIGRTIGFPTLNLANTDFNFKTGVYACQVILSDKTYPGVLYLGPRHVLNETKTICEIHLLKRIPEVYGEEIDFELVEFIRDPIEFTDLPSMQKQIKNDVERAKGILN